MAEGYCLIRVQRKPYNTYISWQKDYGKILLLTEPNELTQTGGGLLGEDEVTACIVCDPFKSFYKRAAVPPNFSI